MVRECELKTPIEAIQYDGRNWDEIDEFLGAKHNYKIDQGKIHYSFKDKSFIEAKEGDYIVRMKPGMFNTFINVYTKHEFDVVFKLKPLELEQKIIDDFDATEEI